MSREIISLPYFWSGKFPARRSISRHPGCRDSHFFQAWSEPDFLHINLIPVVKIIAKKIFFEKMHFLTYFLDFHFLRGLFIGIYVFLSTSFKLETSNFGSAHLLWIHYNWYFKFLDFLFFCWVMALFKILCTTIHSKFYLSDLNSDHTVPARTFKILLSIPHQII